MPVILSCFCIAATAGGRVKAVAAAAAVLRSRKSRRVVVVVTGMVEVLLGSDVIRSLAAAWVPGLGVYRLCLFSSRCSGSFVHFCDLRSRPPR